MKAKTAISVSEETLKRIDGLKITEGESHENVIMRLMKVYYVLMEE